MSSLGEKLDDHGAHIRKNSSPFYDELKCNKIDTKGKFKASNSYFILHSFFTLFVVNLLYGPSVVYVL